MAELSEKHLRALRHAGYMWSVQPRNREGATMIAVRVGGGDEVLLPPSTAKALGCALIHAAIEAMTDPTND